MGLTELEILTVSAELGIIMGFIGIGFMFSVLIHIMGACGSYMRAAVDVGAS